MVPRGYLPITSRFKKRAELRGSGSFPLLFLPYVYWCLLISQYKDRRISPKSERTWAGKRPDTPDPVSRLNGYAPEKRRCRWHQSVHPVNRHRAEKNRYPDPIERIWGGKMSLPSLRFGGERVWGGLRINH